MRGRRRLGLENDGAGAAIGMDAVSTTPARHGDCTAARPRKPAVTRWALGLFLRLKVKGPAQNTSAAWCPANATALITCRCGYGQSADRRVLSFSRRSSAPATDHALRAIRRLFRRKDASFPARAAGPLIAAGSGRRRSPEGSSLHVRSLLFRRTQLRRRVGPWIFRMSLP